MIAIEIFQADFDLKKSGKRKVCQKIRAKKYTKK